MISVSNTIYVYLAVYNVKQSDHIARSKLTNLLSLITPLVQIAPFLSDIAKQVSNTKIEAT